MCRATFHQDLFCCRLCWTMRTTAATQDGPPSVSIRVDLTTCILYISTIIIFWSLWSCNFTTSSFTIQLLNSWRSWEDIAWYCWLLLAICLRHLYVCQVCMTLKLSTKNLHCFYMYMTLIRAVVTLITLCAYARGKVPYFLEISPQRDLILRGCTMRRQFKGGICRDRYARTYTTSTIM